MGNSKVGNRLENKGDRNPPVGLYAIEEAEKLTKSKSRSALITEDYIKESQRRKPGHSPEPGQYDAHLTPFGSDIKTN